MERVVVGLERNGKLKLAKFSECIVDFFSKDAQFVTVKLELSNRILTLTESTQGHKLAHSSLCPIKILSECDFEGDKMKDSDVNVAVSVIIESSDHHILLTKRPGHMRSSPNVWVLPGGHLEADESLFQGGIREVKEETGLDISGAKGTILCLWENVYPIILGLGTPTNHVLIVYFHVQLKESSQQLQQKMNPDTEEVAAFCWLNRHQIFHFFNTSDNFKHKPKKFELINNKIIQNDLDLTNMFNRHLWLTGECFSGVQFALKTWLYRFDRNTTSKF